MENNRWTAWAFNVIDEYKSLTEEEIKKLLAEKASPFAVLMENWVGDFNIGQCIRNANNFGAREVFYIGRRHLDRRGAVGTYKYTPVSYLENLDKLKEVAKRYRLIGVDNLPGSVPIQSFDWPDNCLMAFGEEGTGLTPEIVSLCEAVVSIPTLGSVRSLNAGCASGIAMFDYVTKKEKSHV